MSLEEMRKRRPPPKNCKWIVRMSWGDGEKIHSYFIYQHTAEKFAKFSNDVFATTLKTKFWVEEIK